MTLGSGILTRIQLNNNLDKDFGEAGVMVGFIGVIVGIIGIFRFRKYD